jgi:hypothetical protein
MSVRQEGKFSAMDVAVMMTILKITRAKSNPSNSDNLLMRVGICLWPVNAHDILWHRPRLYRSHRSICAK